VSYEHPVLVHPSKPHVHPASKTHDPKVPISRQRPFLPIVQAESSWHPGGGLASGGITSPGARAVGQLTAVGRWYWGTSRLEQVPPESAATPQESQDNQRPNAHLTTSR
jgi:hypothetical protein